jgi:hypothetical protein
MYVQIDSCQLVERKLDLFYHIVNVFGLNFISNTLTFVNNFFWGRGNTQLALNVDNQTLEPFPFEQEYHLVNKN